MNNVVASGRVRNWATLGLLWCGLGLCVVALWRYWPESAELVGRMTLGSSLLLVVLLLSIWTLAVRNWRLIVLAFTGRPLTNAIAARHLAYLVLGKYVPGGIWGFVARLSDSSVGQRTGPLLVAGMAEQFMSLVSLACMACVLLLASMTGEWSWLVLGVIVPMAGVVSTAILNRAVRTAARMLPHKDDVTTWAFVSPAKRPMWYAAMMSVAQQTLVMLVVVVVASPAYKLDPLAAAGVAGSYGLASALGILTIVAPGGIIVREALFVAFSDGWLPAPQAIALAAGLRLVFTVFDLLSGFMARSLRSLGGV